MGRRIIKTAMADVRIFPIGSKVPVFLNWDSFVSLGIDPGWQDAFSNAIVACCARWAQISGVDCRHEFSGLTTATTPAAGQVVIVMNDHHADTNRLASTFASGGSAVIVFHRKSGATLTPWNFVAYQANAGEFDVQAILMHEFGSHILPRSFARLKERHVRKLHVDVSLRSVRG